jgi:TolA-binding protein
MTPEKQQQNIDILKRYGISGVTVIAFIFGIGAWVTAQQNSTAAVRCEVERINREGSSVSHQNSSDIRVLKERIDLLNQMAQENKTDHIRIMTMLEKVSDKLDAK